MWGQTAIAVIRHCRIQDLPALSPAPTAAKSVPPAAVPQMVRLLDQDMLLRSRLA